MQQTKLAFKGQMDSRLRGNDALGFFEVSPEAAWIRGSPRLATGLGAIGPSVMQYREQR